MASILVRLYRRARYGRPIVVVSGLPRSGTSMAMKMLEAGGMAVYSDGVRTADEDNPRGYFEYERVKDLAREADKSWLAEARGKAVKIISYLLKDLPPTHNYKVVFMDRNLDEVLASQAKMLARRGEAPGGSDEKMKEIFREHLWKVDYLVKHSVHLDVLRLSYKEVVERPREQAERLRGFLGGRLDVGRMVEAVDRQLYRNRA